MTDKIEPDYYKTQQGDLINHWYKKWGRSADIILVANIEKYLERYRDKNGMEDLVKAKTYLDRLIAEQKEKAPLGEPSYEDDPYGYFVNILNKIGEKSSEAEDDQGLDNQDI